MNIKLLLPILLCVIFFGCDKDDPDNTGNTDTLVDLSAAINSTHFQINEGEKINFTGIVSGNPDNINWTFEGGNPSTSEEDNPTVSYENYGKYNVTLTVTREVDNATVTVQEEVVVMPGKELLAYYPFNANAVDESISANAFNGSINGCTLSDDKEGIANSAYSFIDDDFIEISNDIDNTFENGVTFSCWVNIKADQSSNRIFSNYSGEGVGGDCQERVGFQLSTNEDNQVRIIYLSDGNDYIGRLTESQAFTLNTWHHILCTWNGEFESSGFEIYIDGQRSDIDNFETGSVTCGYLDSKFPLMIGRNTCNTGPCQFFNGVIDEFRVYNTKLSLDQIELLAE